MLLELSKITDGSKER